MSSDYELVENLLHNIHPGKQTDLAQIQWIDEVIDTNNGNYSAGNIKFDTLNQKNFWIDYAHGFITSPFVINASIAITSLTALNVAFKNGIANLIYSVSMTINNKKIQNTDNANRYQAILQMVNDSYDWETSNGGMYHLYKDSIDSNVAAEFATGITFPVGSIVAASGSGISAVAAVPAVATTLFGAKNLNYNDGFFKRIQMLSPSYVPPSGGVTGYWSVRAIIPLALISGFFKELNTPLFNVRFQLSIGITSLVNGSTGCTPIMADAAAIAAGTSFSISIANQGAIKPASADSSCKLYLPQVHFSAEVNEKLAKLINSSGQDGFKKVVTFYDTKSTISTLVNTSGASNFRLNQPLTPGIIAPRRLWVTATPKGSDGLHSSPSPCQSTGTLSLCNILIDGKKHYSSDLQYDFEFYNLLKQEFCTSGDDTQTGSLVSYTDFATPLGNHRYYVFNLSRYISSLKDPLQPVAISFQGQIKDTIPMDVWFHLEHECVVEINLSTGMVATYGSN